MNVNTNANTKRILIVDDESDLVEIVKLMLCREGYQVEGAESGSECMEKLKHYHPDLILLDIMMPGLDGWKTLKLIKSDDNLSSVKVAMLTAKKLSAETLKKEEIALLADYINKPFTRESLVQRVKKILETGSGSQFFRA